MIMISTISFGLYVESDAFSIARPRDEFLVLSSPAK